jgi:23S rRNA (cytosine1962-C5)-methyltransferase
MEAMTGILVLKAGREKPILNHHPWVFSGAVARLEGDPAPGDIVAVTDPSGRFLASGTYNPHSQILARLLSWDPNQPINEAFWRDRLQRAIDGRAALRLAPATTAYRLVNAEADGLPGLIVDVYGDFLVMQCLTTGMDQRKEQIASLLADLTGATGIIERSDASVRAKEGLQPATGLLHGAAPPADFTVTENSLGFEVDLLAGQKTGLYLDQRDNRARLGTPAICEGARVLDVFAYTGGFSVYAAAAGAAAIVNIDTSIPALETAERNIALNGFDRPQDEYIAGDAFEVLRYYRDEGEQFDVVILDPPKFAHNRGDIPKASRGYKDLNWLALRLLRPGGILATFSCSGLVTADLFQKIIFGAAEDAGRTVQVLAPLAQGPDHPLLLSFPESAYLKGLLCRVW